MPKIVDHARRRRELAVATWAVIREHGVAGASIRAVAAQAGWSASAVQYYIKSQDELLDFAMKAISQTADAQLRDLRLPADPVEAAVLTLEALLPLDGDSRAATGLWAAFLSRTLVKESTAELNAQMNRQLRDLCRELVTPLVEVGRRDVEAARLHALFDGMALQAVTDARLLPPGVLRAVLRAHLESLTARFGDSAAPPSSMAHDAHI